MPIHVPRSTAIKKQETLAKREEALRNVLRNNVALEKQHLAAEKVRVAFINMLKAKEHWIDKSGVNSERQLANIEAERRYWQDIEVTEIISKYNKDED